MTREEAIDFGEMFLEVNKDSPNSNTYKFVEMAIKELKKEIAIDKIRERVELEKLGYPPSAGYYKAIMKVLDIIDKYKTESEK